MSNESQGQPSTSKQQENLGSVSVMQDSRFNPVTRGYDSEPEENLGNVGDSRFNPVTRGYDSEPEENLGNVGDSRFKLATRGYDPERQHDVVRTIITCSFILIFALTILASFVIGMWFRSDWASAKEQVQLLLPAETALLGSALGFYFGSQGRAPASGG